jgi:hypothetical protein
MTFFGATFIGKAVFKVSIQCFFIIIMFSQHHVENLLGFIERNIPFLKNQISNSLEKQKKKLFSADAGTDVSQ